MQFEIIGKIENQETFATGKRIRELSRLQKIYWKEKWRKRKGETQIKLANGSIKPAELHWHEATGIGKKEFNIRRYLD